VERLQWDRGLRALGAGAAADVRRRDRDRELGVGHGQIEMLAALFHADAPNHVTPSAYNEDDPMQRDRDPTPLSGPALSRRPSSAVRHDSGRLEVAGQSCRLVVVQ
jgi:hypothetical protein